LDIELLNENDIYVVKVPKDYEFSSNVNGKKAKQELHQHQAKFLKLGKSQLAHIKLITGPGKERSYCVCPEWLFLVKKSKYPCDCPSRILFMYGCLKPKYHI
jgi:hypothetical protein